MSGEEQMTLKSQPLGKSLHEEMMISMGSSDIMETFMCGLPAES